MAFTLSVIIGFIFFATNQILILYDFRERVISLRGGVYSWDENPTKISLAASALFVGAHVSFSVIGMSLTTIILTFGLAPLFLKYSWILLWEHRVYLLTIIISSISQILLKQLTNKYIFRGDGRTSNF